MSVFLYVDNSNVWIEGMRLSAVKNHTAVDISDAMNNNIVDRGWRCDFGQLLYLTGGNKSGIKKSHLYGSRPPEADSIWNAAKAQGFSITVYDRNYNNREKKIDTQIVSDIIGDALTVMNAGDEIMLVSGDADYVPAIEKIKDLKKGIIFNVASWDHSISPELKSKRDNFISLTPHLQNLKSV